MKDQDNAYYESLEADKKKVNYSCKQSFWSTVWVYF